MVLFEDFIDDTHDDIVRQVIEEAGEEKNFKVERIKELVEEYAKSDIDKKLLKAQLEKLVLLAQYELAKERKI